MTAKAEPDPKVRETAKRLLDRYRDNPTLFFEEVLGVRVWAGTQRILDAVARNRRVAIRSGHKIGKSKTVAGIAHWWVCTRKDGLVVMSAPTARQVETILWREFKATYRAAKVTLGPKPAVKPSTGYQLSDDRGVYGFSTKEPERMAGISGAELLFIIDEASGFPEDIFEAIEGNMAGGASAILTSNPTKTSGTFFDAFHTKANFWKTVHVSGEEAAALEPPIRGLATREYIEEKEREWGRDSPIFAVRILGNFPKQSSNAVIGLSLVTDAIARWEEHSGRTDEEVSALGPLELGVDPSRFGDDEAVIVARRGVRVLEVVAVQGLDGIQLAGEVRKRARKWHRAGQPKPRVKVDVIGVGASCFDQLSTFDDLEVVGVNVANTSSTPEDFGLVRDEVWFRTRDWLATGEIPDDGKLQAELVAPEYKFDAKGRQRVESKDDMKKRIKRSPDRADALGLAVYNAAVHVRLSELDETPQEPDRFPDERGF